VRRLRVREAAPTALPRTKSLSQIYCEREKAFCHSGRGNLCRGGALESRATMDNNEKRLIEVDFPLKQTSLDSVHEKNVRHAHISTLHIWPARRPLAASRAAIIPTLLPDPGTPLERKRLLEKLGGSLEEVYKPK